MLLLHWFFMKAIDGISSFMQMSPYLSILYIELSFEKQLFSLWIIPFIYPP